MQWNPIVALICIFLMTTAVQHFPCAMLSLNFLSECRRPLDETVDWMEALPKSELGAVTVPPATVVDDGAKRLSVVYFFSYHYDNGLLFKHLGFNPLFTSSVHL